MGGWVGGSVVVGPLRSDSTNECHEQRCEPESAKKMRVKHRREGGGGRDCRQRQ